MTLKQLVLLVIGYADSDLKHSKIANFKFRALMLREKPVLVPITLQVHNRITIPTAAYTINIQERILIFCIILMLIMLNVLMAGEPLDSRSGPL